MSISFLNFTYNKILNQDHEWVTTCIVWIIVECKNQLPSGYVMVMVSICSDLGWTPDMTPWDVHTLSTGDFNTNTKDKTLHFTTIFNIVSCQPGYIYSFQSNSMFALNFLLSFWFS